MTEALTFAQMIGLSLIQVRGPKAAETVANNGIELQSDWFRHTPITGGGFAVQTGVREVFVLDMGAEKVLRSASLHRAAGDGTWVFQREDHIFAFEGTGWRELLLAVCAYEFEQNRGGDFVMTILAGISCWLALPHQEDDPVVFGCDPSYGEYLKSTLTDVVAEMRLNVDATKLHATSGEAHDA
jgi:hypothetical protein